MLLEGSVTRLLPTYNLDSPQTGLLCSCTKNCQVMRSCDPKNYQVMRSCDPNICQVMRSCDPNICPDVLVFESH